MQQALWGKPGHRKLQMDIKGDRPVARKASPVGGFIGCVILGAV
jgi:hypothetical protein